MMQCASQMGTMVRKNTLVHLSFPVAQDFMDKEALHLDQNNIAFRFSIVQIVLFDVDGALLKRRERHCLCIAR